MEAAYGRRFTGGGPTYRERLKGQFECRESGNLLAAVSLTSHLMTQHGRVAETRRRWSTPAAGVGPQTFTMTFQAKGGPQSCPVEGCLVRVAKRTEMRVHFLHQHVLNTVVILEEVNLPSPPVRPMQHAVSPAGPGRQAPGHGPVCQGSGAERSGAEEAGARGVGDKGEIGAGL